MRRKNLMTAFLCAVCLAVGTAAPAVLAEETEVVTEAAEDSTEAKTTEKEARPEYTASDYVKLGEYKGLKVEKPDSEVTEEEVDEKVNSNIRLAGEMETLTEGKVQKGDIANIDYEGKLDGKAFDGGTAAAYDLEIGSNEFIDGFEDGLIGVEVGDTVDLNLTFPEHYGNADLAGKETVFTVTVNEIKRIPELTDELASKISEGEYSTASGYRESVRTELADEKESNNKLLMQSDLINQAIANSEIKEYPQEMVDYGINNMKSYYQDMADMYSMEFADFLSQMLGLTEEEFNQQAEDAVKQSLQQEMTLQAIAEHEDIVIDDAAYEEGCKYFADLYGYESAEALQEQYDHETIRVSILQDKVLDFLLENAEVVEASDEPEADSEAVTEKETAAEADTEAATEESTEAAETEAAETEAVAAEAETETAAEAETE